MRRLSGLLFLAAVAAAAIVVTLAFNPAVSTFELQRRDRLGASGQFVDATYRLFLGRPADTSGLADYQARYDRDGPEAVVLGIMSSQEFRDKHPDGQPPHTAAFEPSPGADPNALAAQYVAAYRAGAIQPRAPDDMAGRFGFVALLVLTAAGILTLQRWSHRPLSGNALHTFLPRSYIVGLFAALAVVWFLNGQALFYTFAPGSIGYAEWLDGVAGLSLARGVAHVWTPYPQGTQLLLVTIQGVASTVSSWLRSDVLTSYTLFRWLFQAAFLLVPSILLVSLVYEMGMHFSPASATIAASVVAFSFAPMYYGIGSTLVTDPLPVLLALLATWFAIRQRSGWAAVLLGIGAALKLIPLVLLVPAIVLAANHRSRASLLLGCGAVLLCVFVPFALADPDMFWSPFRWQTSRPAWESWYAFGNWLVGAPHEYTSPAFEDIGVKNSFGWVFWGITPPLSSLVSPVPAAAWRIDNAISLVGTSASLLAIVAAKSHSPRAIVRWAMYALTVTFFWSIGWSPQYELYLVPLVALAFESPLVAIGAALGLEVVTFLEYPLLLPWAYFYGGSAVWLAWGSTVARYLMLGWFAVFVLRHEASWTALCERVRHLARPARSAALVGGVVVVLAAPVALAAEPMTQPASTCGPTRSTAQLAFGFIPDLDWSLGSGWFFSEAGQSTDHGYTIADDGEARMWSEFNRLGGWPALGFPASRRFMWHGTLTQATQRAVLEWSPVTGQVDFANVLDLMHEQGRDEDLRQLKQIPPPLDVDEAGLPYEVIAARRLAWLDDRPAIKNTYCNAPGGADPVQLWGLPTSQAVNMSDAGGEVYVLRTQRAAFQEWVGGAPWAAPGEVTVVLAGDLAKEFDLLPAEALVPEPAPPRNS